MTPDPGSPYLLLFRSPRGHLPMLDKATRNAAARHPTTTNTHWMESRRAVFLLVSIWKLTTLCMSLWSLGRENLLWDLYGDITSVTFLLLDQTCFKKRNCESFYCLKQTATAPKNINEPSKNLWFWEFVCSGVKNKAVYNWSSTPGAKLRTLFSNSIQFYSYCR